MKQRLSGTADVLKALAATKRATKRRCAETSLEKGDRIRAAEAPVSARHAALPYEVLLYADGDDAVTYAEAAHLAAILIDESVERLDSVRFRPMIDAIKHKSQSQDCDYPLAEEKLRSSGDDEVREHRVIYMH